MSTASKPVQLPLFPLRSVLFPGGLLALIFVGSAVATMVWSRAPRISVTAARNAYQKLALKLARITRNSPTKPEVPGNPAFAMAKSTMKAPNIGIRLITPP